VVGHHHLMPRIITPAPILPIRLIALDIDGTLVGDDLLIGAETRAAVKAARSRGVVVSLVTGRMVSSAMRFARELGLDAPLVGYQGGLIRDMPDLDSPRIGRLLLHTPLPAAVARDIVEWTRSMGLDPHLNRLERFILRADDPHADDYSAFMGARAELVPDLVEAIRHPITKVLAVADPPVPTDVAPLARERFAGVADVTISHPRFLEFVAPGVSKGRAIRWLARRLGVPLGATLAIGDQWNDLEMLAEVGHGAAMPTAPSEVRAVARYIAPSLTEEGVARMIKDLVLASPTKARAASERLAATAVEQGAGAAAPFAQPAAAAAVEQQPAAATDDDRAAGAKRTASKATDGSAKRAKSRKVSVEPATTDGTGRGSRDSRELSDGVTAEGPRAASAPRPKGRERSRPNASVTSKPRAAGAADPSAIAATKPRTTLT
jgi:Cof subfamily protein (haloacid dehalogenase superfamily)